MLVKKRSTERGDTLIEVLFAVSVFSLVAVGGLAVMNQGAATSQRSLEVTLVRQEMDSQSETLRFLNSSYIAAYKAGGTYGASTPAGQWARMTANVQAHPLINATALGGAQCPSTHPAGSFILNTQLATFIDPTQNVIVPAKTFAHLNYVDDGSGNMIVSSAEGLWIEGIRSAKSTDTSQATIGYIDFHILACWDSPGQSVPVTLGTIVRLYEPR